MTDYEQEYQRSPKACGEPFEVFVAFFEQAASSLSILDLGCGQGRDALVAARLGHRVFGIDIAATGIEQLLSTARDEHLQIEAEVGDIESFTPTTDYDVVVLDRVVHMLSEPPRKLGVLEKAARATRKGGHVLIADTQKNRAMIRKFFDDLGWLPRVERGDSLIVQRPK